MHDERFKYAEHEERYQRRVETIRKMTDQELLAAYTTEMQKLKRLLSFGRRSEHFQGYPKTSLMNQYRRVLVSRKVTIPPITLSSVESGPSVGERFEEYAHLREKRRMGW